MGQTTRLAPRRIVTDSGHIIQIEDQKVTCAFYKFAINLAPRNAPVAIPWQRSAR
jgi:hypothetical protein